MFDDKAASRALSQWGNSLSNAANQINASSGRESESPLFVAIKAFFWQWYVWKFLRSNLRAEIALFVLPLAVFLIFAASAFLFGILGTEISSTENGLFPFYLMTTLIFWVAVVLVSIAVALFTFAVRTIRRLIWWIRRG